MALLTSEIERLRFETGYNVVSVGAEPYISTVRVFDDVIKEYVRGGALTQSSTTIVPPDDSKRAFAASIVLDDPTGFSVGDRVWIDVDDWQESATVRGVTGDAISVLLKGPHQGVYPVTVEGGEAIVRQLLRYIAFATANLGSLIVLTQAGLKRADEVEWYPSYKNGLAPMAQSASVLRDKWRDELCSAIGVTNLWKVRDGQYSGSPVLY